MNNLVQRIITGTLFLVVMIGSIWFSQFSFVALMCIIAMLCFREYILLAKKIASPAVAVNFSVAAGLLFVAAASVLLRFRYYFECVMFLAPVIIIFAELFRKTGQPFVNIGVGLAGIFYVILPFALLLHIGYLPSGATYEAGIVLGYFTIIWVNDTFAYVVGRLIGRHKLAPSISAGKTVEGTIGGIVMAVVAAALTYRLFVPGRLRFSEDITLPVWMGFAFLTASLAVASDLSESRLKRAAGVKDSGNLLPGHGGFLDRFDSVLLTAPVIFVYLIFIQYAI